jgi:uncharacterized membrane protein YGL010W
MDASKPRQIDQLIATYGESHQHPVNEIIHFICVPTIVFTILGLIWSLHPLGAVGMALASIIYYLPLSVPMAIGSALMMAPMLLILALMPQALIGQISILIFVLAWIGQFIGHKIEGKKPSFFDDVRFLMIGPVFVLSFLYRRLHIQF